MSSENPDFTHRAELSEWMDEPASYAEFRACLCDLIKVNRTVFSYRPTLEWLAHVAAGATEPLHIVDVGSGAGDMLRRIEQWATRAGIPVRLTGIDRNPYAARAAREFNGDGSAIEWITGEASEYRPQTRIDLVISSLFAHHLPDAEIVRFLEWMEQTAMRGWFVNDLRRGRGAYYTFTVLAHAMRWHRFVRHDGPVSIRRAFCREDWRTYVERAGIGTSDVRIFAVWPGRLCVSREK